MAPYVNMSARDVQAIWNSGKQIIELSGQRLAAIRERRLFEAIQLKNQINRIKRQISEKYDILV